MFNCPEHVRFQMLQNESIGWDGNAIRLIRSELHGIPGLIFDNKNLLRDISEVLFGSVFVPEPRSLLDFALMGLKTMMSMTVEWYFIMFCF